MYLEHDLSQNKNIYKIAQSTWIENLIKGARRQHKCYTATPTLVRGEGLGGCHFQLLVFPAESLRRPPHLT